VRYYAHLPTLSWDAIDPAWLDRVLADCRTRGLTPYFAVESWELEGFRSRFRGHSAAAGLDWPPLATLGNVIFVYDRRTVTVTLRGIGSRRVHHVGRR